MTLLLLAGTGEARRLAERLAKSDVPVVASLAGATRQPLDLAVPTRHGGFGGAAGFQTFLNDKAITAVLDATHPFAARISHRTAAICGAETIPYAQVLRRQWVPEDGDNWSMVANEEDVASLIPNGSTVFLATGRQTLDRFHGLTGCRLICRQIDPPDRPFPFEGGEFLIGRPPFSTEDEQSLFAELGIDWLVVKNAGGTASKTKLLAARHMGLPVAMIHRPLQPKGTKLQTVDEAMAWIRALPW